MTEIPIACTLTATGQAVRVDQWRALLHGAAREPVDGGVRISLDAELAGQVAALAAAEQQCCAFFDFTLRLTGGRLWFEVRAPADAAPLHAELFG